MRGFKNILWVMLFLFAALAVPGCYSGNMHTGNVIDDAKVEQIQKGKTPIRNLITWFGSPASHDSPSADGTELYLFSHMDNRYKSRPLALWGDSNESSRTFKTLEVKVLGGIVQDYKYSVMH